MSLANDINALVKIKKIKQPLTPLPARIPIDSVKGEDNSTEENQGTGGGGMVPPLTLEILTYDDTKDVDFKDTSDVTHTFKTAMTAQITDDEGTVFAIDSITYAAP